MLGRIPDRISIRYQVVLTTSLLVFAAALVLGSLSYITLRHQLLSGLDARLYTAAHLAARVPPAGYFDGIDDATSISQEAYEALVARNNRLSLDLDLQYLWSCMLVDGTIVFTTSTSPSKEVTKGDHAGFFEVHRDPHSFDKVFSTMEPDYSSFENEWGQGRMVLVPATDSRGRKICFGASVGTDDVHDLLAATALRTILLSTLILVAGMALSYLVASKIARPIEQLTGVADAIAHGNLRVQTTTGGSSELRSLSDSITLMSGAIDSTVAALQTEVTARRQSEEELAVHRDHLEDIVAARTEELRRSNRDLEQFAYVASHDLHDPLRMVRSYLQLLEADYGDRLDERGRTFIGFAADGAARMQQLISDLLAYARVTSQGQTLRKIQLLAALDDGLANLAVPLAETGAQVTHDPLPEVMADPGQLAQVFQNLIGNALKFRSEAPPRIHVAAEARAGEWCVSVRDNGIGVDAKHREEIFTIFRRLHTWTEHQGTGIGLALCKRIVERHGGRIWMRSESGVGSTFFFTIPRSAS